MSSETGTIQVLENVEPFFKLLFGKTEGYFCIAVLNPFDKSEMKTYWFVNPTEINEAISVIKTYQDSHNVYFCPQLFREIKRTKENVSAAPTLWADLDTCSPDKLLVPPSVVVESSPGRYQAYWVLDNTEVLPSNAEALCKRIAYHHADDGCDTSGWDLTQLLRVPGTYNFKYQDYVNIPIVTVLKAEKLYYRTKDFVDYPEVVTDKFFEARDLPDNLEEQSGIELLSNHSKTINPKVLDFFGEPPEDNEWSDRLWALQNLLFENGFNAEQTFVIARDAKCNKFARDNRPMQELWKDVLRAEGHYKAAQEYPVKNPFTVTQLLSAEERERVKSLPNTFVEDYIHYASTTSDAAKQYHQAGAFIILSAMLSATLKLPTSYGTIAPNLWFMILGDTTLTRKSTSMDIAMSLIEEVYPDAVMATDGTTEGIFTNLSMRPGMPSIFLRDEISGLLSSMIKKDYMSDMPELLTKLYDGKMQKRILRKEVLTINDPRFIIFSGGIKKKVTSTLTSEFVTSGFLPRFIFITAKSDAAKIRPLGRPTKVNVGDRDKILNAVKRLFHHYNGQKVIKIEGVDEVLNTPKEFEADLTDEAWQRYGQLETVLVESGLESNLPDLLTPVGSRLANSILKAAMLIAASRQVDNDSTEITVELDDMLRAIKYGELWREYGEEIISSIASSPFESQINEIMNMLRKAGRKGLSRSAIMRAFHLSSREANGVFETLLERDMVNVVRDSNKQYFTARV